MPDSAGRDPGDTRDAQAPADAAEDRPSERIDRGIADFVRRAVSAGVGAASRSKEDIMRTAAGEVRSWLEHMNLSDELAKALSTLVIEMKTEIRFRPADGGKLVPQTTSDVKIKSSDP
jgi:hypothetical protein